MTSERRNYHRNPNVVCFYFTASMCVQFLLLLLFTTDVHGDKKQTFPEIFTVGAVLSDNDHCQIFRETIAHANKDDGLLPSGVTLNASCIRMNNNPIVAAEMVCDSLIPSHVYVTITSRALHSDLSPMSVSFTCGFYSIPVIGISARDSSYSDKNVHTTFMRTVAPFSEQAVIWDELLKYFEFKQIIFIHSSDQEGRAMLGKFQARIEMNDNELHLEKNLKYVSGQSDYRDVLASVEDLSSRVILLYASEKDAERIYHDAGELNLTGLDYVWIVTEQAMKPANTPIGVLGLKLEYSTDEEAHIKDSVRIIAQALSDMHKDGQNLTEAPGDCDADTGTDDLDEWESGALLLDYLKEQTLEFGKTGHVQFDDVGDRIHSSYLIYNKHSKGLVPIGSYTKEGVLYVKKDSIVWPGNVTKQPKGIKISTHLRVVTMPTVPFIYATRMTQGECEPNKVPCPKFNETEGTSEDYCCYGYCMDLLEELSKKVNFTYEVHLSPVGLYGSFERKNGTRPQWTGMIGELLSGKTDLIVAPLTVTPERARVIDFTKPFKYQGMTILVKKTTKDSSLASFLQPFQDTLWILVGLSVHVVALVLYLLDRFSPFGRFKLAKSDDTEEDALNLSGAVWFAWGVLLNSGIGEGTPRSFSARVLGMVWAGFAMIIVASYTANLAAFLVLDRPEASISGIDDARLRNPQENFLYATVRDSAVAMYFKRQVELSTMYRTMETRYYNNEKDAILAVKNGELHAFIWDSSRLEYEAANDCDLVTAGELFGRSGYGIGLTRGSPWTEEISLAILTFHETGYMEVLDNKWILLSDTKCPERDASPATLGLTNMAGVFMMVAGGIVAGVFLIFIEIAYKRHRGLKEKELELAKTAADRWRGNIERRKLLRETRALLRKELQLDRCNHQSGNAGSSLISLKQKPQLRTPNRPLPARRSWSVPLPPKSNGRFVSQLAPSPLEITYGLFSLPVCDNGRVFHVMPRVSQSASRPSVLNQTKRTTRY